MERSEIGSGEAVKVEWIKRENNKERGINNKEGGAEEGIEIWKKRIRSV